FWWFWFAASGPRQDAARRQVVATLIGVFVTLVLARAIAAAVPMRLRPMYMPDIGYHAPSLEMDMNLENWNAFPSDTAAFFVGLGFGIWRLSRGLGAVAMAYIAVWICLPRVYLGIHYPSDIVAGAALGIAVVWAMGHLMAPGRWLGRIVMAPVLALESRRPAVFYVSAFLVSYEMAVLFDDIRDLLRSALHMARQAGYAAADEEILFLLAATLALTICAA